MKITVCIGSSCHLKGSRQVVEALQEMISEQELKDKIDLSGTFCLGNCQKGVCVTVDGVLHSVSPQTAKEFFEAEVMTKL